MATQTNPNSLANLRPQPWRPGEKRNPHGRPKIAKFRRALDSVLAAKKKGESVPRLKLLLIAATDRAQTLAETAESLEELAQLVPRLNLFAVILDGKLPEDGKTATKESRVILVGGQVDRTEEVLSTSETVRLETGDGQADN